MRILLVILFFGSISWAHIPKTRTVLERAAKAQGAGNYLIELELQFQVGTEPVLTRELWWIQDAEIQKMVARIQTASSGFQPFRTATYKSGAAPADYFESLFHQRTLESFMRRLVQQKVLPPNAAAQTRVGNLKNFKYEPDPFSTYTKIGNQFFLGLGPHTKDSLDIRLWVEPEKFLMRKVRLASRAEIVADQYEPHPRGLWYPKERMVNYDGKSVMVRTLAVRSKSDPGELAAAFEKTVELPLPSEVREFYSRFR